MFNKILKTHSIFYYMPLKIAIHDIIMFNQFAHNANQHINSNDKRMRRYKATIINNLPFPLLSPFSLSPPLLSHLSPLPHPPLGTAGSRNFQCVSQCSTSPYPSSLLCPTPSPSPPTLRNGWLASEGGSWMFLAISTGCMPMFMRRTVWSCTNWMASR
jgi:hypothetical protein